MGERFTPALAGVFTLLPGTGAIRGWSNLPSEYTRDQPVRRVTRISGWGVC